MTKREEIAKNIRNARLSAGMTQSDLAVAIGCLQPDVSRRESGKSDVTLEYATDVAFATGVGIRNILPKKKSKRKPRTERS